MGGKARYLLLIIVLAMSCSTVLLICYTGLDEVYSENVKIFLAIGLLDLAVVALVIITVSELHVLVDLPST